MDDYTNNNLADGALGLRSQAGVEAMTWLEDGKVGIGTTNPTRKLHVYGSAMIKDTLYAGAINPSLMSAAHLPDEPGVASVLQGQGNEMSVPTTWTTVISREITVPGPGFVLAIASSYVSVDHTYLDLGMMVAGIAESPSGPSTSRWISCGVDDHVGTGEFYFPLTCHTIYDVGAAATYTYYFMVVKSVVVDDVLKVHDAQLSLLYVPTSYGTVSMAKSAGTTTPEPVGSLGTGRAKSSIDPTATDYAEELRALRERMELLEKELEETKK
jgi:hypothetical protein